MRVRRAALVAQARWRLLLAKKSAAARAVQAIARGWLVRRRLHAQQRAATRIQSVWRGCAVRAGHLRRRRLAEIRASLEAVTAAARSVPLESRATLAKRADAALATLASVPFPQMVREWCGMYMGESEIVLDRVGVVSLSSSLPHAMPHTISSLSRQAGTAWSTLATCCAASTECRRRLYGEAGSTLLQALAGSVAPDGRAAQETQVAVLRCVASVARDR